MFLGKTAKSVSSYSDSDISGLGASANNTSDDSSFNNNFNNF